MKVVDTGRLRVAYREVGEGAPLVLLHGGLATGEAWAPVVPLLADHFRVIVPDTRGHGGTVNPETDLSYRQLGEDVAAFIQALGLERPAVVGWSDGGQAALELAVRHPGRAGALVLGGVWFRFTEAYRETNRRTGFPAPGEVDFARLDGAALAARHGPGWPELTRAISRLFWTPLHYDPGELAGARDPVLVLVGDRDGFVPVEEALALHHALPYSQLAVLPGADHGLPERSPQDFARTVRAFVQAAPTQHAGLRTT